MATIIRYCTASCIVEAYTYNGEFLCNDCTADRGLDGEGPDDAKEVYADQIDDLEPAECGYCGRLLFWQDEEGNYFPEVIAAAEKEGYLIEHGTETIRVAGFANERPRRFDTIDGALWAIAGENVPVRRLMLNQ